jgi:hypothetical protein
MAPIGKNSCRSGTEINPDLSESIGYKKTHPGAPEWVFLSCILDRISFLKHSLDLAGLDIHVHAPRGRV